MEAYIGNGGTAVLIPNLTTVWGEWSALCPGLYIPKGRSPFYTLNMRLGGSECQS